MVAAVTLEPGAVGADAQALRDARLSPRDLDSLVLVGAPGAPAVNGKARVEIGGAPHGQLDWLKSLGCFTEIIQYRTRIFIPIDQAEAIIARLLGTGEAL